MLDLAVRLVLGFLLRVSVVCASIMLSSAISWANDYCDLPEQTPTSFIGDKESLSCAAAAIRLPCAIRRGEVSDSDFPDFVKAHRDEFKNYDKACFHKWQDLLPRTRDFLDNIYGGLFIKTANGFQFLCSAFRVSERWLITARHCIYGPSHSKVSLDKLYFRLIGVPTIDVLISGDSRNAKLTVKDDVANDFDDYWYLSLKESPAPFRLTPSDYRENTERERQLLFSGINRAAYVLDDDEDAVRWTDAFRFTRVFGAQWLKQLPHPPPSTIADERCIYHAAPTYAGMSGSPVIASDAFSATGKLYVVGIHLRSGFTSAPYLFDADCGSFPSLNVALSLPSDLILRIDQMYTEDQHDAPH